MELHIASEGEVDTRADAAIRTALCVSFPAERAVFARTRGWHGSNPAWAVWIEDDGAVISYAGVVERTVRVGETPVRVAGVQNACVVPDYRGRGLCKRVMEAVIAEAARRGCEAGLLFCRGEVAAMYEHLGWQLVDRPTTRLESGRELPLPEGNRAMFRPLSLHTLPPGNLHLQGNDW